MGSAGAKAMAVVLGEADVYAPQGRPVRMGQPRLPAAVASGSLGCTVSRIEVPR